MKKRLNLSELKQQYARIRHEAIMNYPKTQRRRRRLAVLSCLHSLSDDLADGLEILGQLKEQDCPDTTPPWLKADSLVATLRACRLDLLRRLQTAGGIPDGDPEIAKLRERLSRESAPGLEIIDICKLLIWYTQINLLIETQAEAATATGLPNEECEDYMHENARAEIPQTRKNQTLARLDDLMAGEEDESIDRLRKRIERRRDKIDEQLEAFQPAFDTMARAHCEGLLPRSSS